MTTNTTEAKVSNWQMYFEVMSSMKTLRKSFLLIIVLMLIYVSFVALEPYFYKLFMDGIEAVMRGEITIPQAKSEFFHLAFIWGGFVIISLLVTLVYRFQIWKLANYEWAFVSNRLARAFICSTYNYHISLNLWERSKNYDRWPMAISQILQGSVLTILPQALLFVSLVILWFWVNWKMMLVVVCFFPVIALVSMLVGKKVHVRQKVANDFWDKTLGRFTDSLQNIAIVKLFAREKHEERVIQEVNNKAITEQLKINILWGILDVGSGFIDFLAKIAIMIVGVFLVIDRTISIGDLFLFVALAGRIFSPLQSMESAYRDIIQRLADYSKMRDVLNGEKEKNLGTTHFSTLSNTLSFESLSFRYPSVDREVLKNVSLEIAKGQKVAFVGHTGSGKTTMTHLLTRFYEPTSGAVRIDGTDIRDFTLESYRSRLAAVFQDTTLFNDTIRHNLEYVRNGVIFDQIRDACRQANILEFIEGLEKWFDTEVGERWLKLSGGEKQRLAIARAIIADPEILILDEATSALDAKTERLVQDAFDHLMQGRTSIIIAHRLSTIRHADRIFLFEKGELIGSGSHDELYLSSPVYREMVDYQKNWFVEERVVI